MRLVLAGSLFLAFAQGAEVRISADRTHVRPGQRLTLALNIEGPDQISALHWAVSASSPVLSTDSVAPVGSNTRVRCGPLGCVAYSGSREALPSGFAVWQVEIPHAAKRGPVDLRVETPTAATPDGSLLEALFPASVRVEITEDGQPHFEPSSVVNAAAARQGLSPGGLASIYGLGFTTAASMEDAGGAREFRGFSVRINGLAAPILAVGRTGSIEQANVQIPFETVAGPAEIEIRNGDASHRVSGIPIAALGPAVFEANGRAAALHADGRPVSEIDPARPGEVVAVFLTGCGQLASSVPTGELGPSPAAPLGAAVQATIGEAASRVDFAGYAPGLLGVCQVNLEVPALVPTNAILVITVGGVSSNPVRLPIG